MVAVDEKAGDPAVGTLLLVSDRKDHREVGLVASGDEGLLTVDHPLVALAYGGGADGAGVGAGPGLGDGEAALALAADGGEEVLLLLLVVGEVEDVVGLTAELELHERTSQLDLDEGVHHRAEPHAAVLLGCVHSEEPGLLRLVPKSFELLLLQAPLVPTLAVQHLGLEWNDLLAHESADPLANLALFLRQVQVHDLTHPCCWRTAHAARV